MNRDVLAAAHSRDATYYSNRQDYRADHRSLSDDDILTHQEGCECQHYNDPSSNCPRGADGKASSALQTSEM
jgi:hypothetical protein